MARCCPVSSREHLELLYMAFTLTCDPNSKRHAPLAGARPGRMQTMRDDSKASKFEITKFDITYRLVDVDYHSNFEPEWT